MAMVKSQLNIKEIIKDYKSGMSLRAIAERHYSNRTTIREKLIESGVYQAPQSIEDKIAPYELKIYLDKISVSDIAKIFKVSQATIYRLISKYHLREKGKKRDGKSKRNKKSNSRNRIRNR